MTDICPSYPAYAATSPLALVWPLLRLPTWTVDESRRLPGRREDGELVERREEIVGRASDDPPGSWRMRLELHAARPGHLLYLLKSPRAVLHAGDAAKLPEIVAHLAELSGAALDTCQEEPQP